MGHYSWTPITSFHVYLFHMPLFFFIGGLLATPISSSLKSWCAKWLRQYLGYLLLWYIIIAALTSLIKHYVDTQIVLSLGQGWWLLHLPLRYNFHNNSLFMVAWFILSYGLASLIFRVSISLLGAYLQSHVVKSLLVVSLVGLGFVAANYGGPIYNADRSQWYLNVATQTSVGLSFMALGFAFRPYLKLLGNLALFCAAASILITFVANGSFSELGMSWSEYPNGYLIHLCSALIGIYCLLAVAYMLSLLRKSTWLCTVGLHSKDIMTMHLLCFVLIDLIMVRLGLMDSTEISALNHYSSENTWLLYMLAGLGLPMLFATLLKQCSNKLIKPLWQTIAATPGSISKLKQGQ